MEFDRVLSVLKLGIEVQESQGLAAFNIENLVKLVKDAEQCIHSDCCVVCRIAQVPQTSTELEEHHIAGKTNFPDTLTACRRCHEHLSDHQKDWLVHRRDTVHRLSSYLFGWADIFDLLYGKSGRPCFLSFARKFRSQGWHTRNGIKG